MTAGMDRDEILRRFEALLDSALAAEAEPAGIGAGILSAVVAGAANGEPRSDAYALWSAMTALTQEIKLQGRAFQDLNHTLAAQTEKTADQLRAVYAEREATVQREAERRCRREILSALIDLRDRLDRGRESVRARLAQNAAVPQTGWWARFRGKQSPDSSAKTVRALFRGYELGIERLNQTLDEFNAREIRCQGEPFDPRRMNALEIEESATAPAGTVLEVYRSGYEWNGELFRPAQVKVSRTASQPQ